MPIKVFCYHCGKLGTHKHIVPIRQRKNPFLAIVQYQIVCDDHAEPYDIPMDESHTLQRREEATYEG
jgi:hypothetical protein